MASRAALTVALALACFAAPALAHYCTVQGKVFCDQCWDGKMDSADKPASGALVQLTCDLGTGGAPGRAFARTGADGTWHFASVQTVQNFKNFKGCTVALVSTNDKKCAVLEKVGPTQVLDPTYGKVLQWNGVYTIPSFALKPAARPATCPICAKGGSLCGDPRLVGGDGVPFWFHGQRDGDFCIVSDRNLHVNAHFIGKATPEGHDLTWVQALAVMFGDHKLYVGAQQEAVWSPHADHLLFALDGEVLLEVSNTVEEAVFEDKASGVKVVRSGKANWVHVEIDGLLASSIEARPIGRNEWTDASCYAHLDMSFEFSQLSGSAEGVLGQTYQKLWSPPNVREGTQVASYILHDVPSYTSTSLFTADCPVSIFEGLPYTVRQADAAPTHLLAVMDDAEEASSTHCSNDKANGGLKCSNK